MSFSLDEKLCVKAAQLGSSDMACLDASLERMNSIQLDVTVQPSESSKLDSNRSASVSRSGLTLFHSENKGLCAWVSVTGPAHLRGQSGNDVEGLIILMLGLQQS